VNACEICGSEATHFCSACGKWLCESRRCKVSAGAKAVRQAPVRALTAAPKFVARELGRLFSAPGQGRFT